MLPRIIQQEAFEAAQFARFSASARNFVEQAGLEQEIMERLELIVEELVLNVAKHGYQAHPGPLAMELSAEGHGIRMRLIDHAPPFDPTALPLPDSFTPLVERPVDGFGLMLVRSMSDSILYRRDGERNVLELFLKPRMTSR